MPRYGLLADVHANLPALEAALAELHDADVLLCAGDLVGYGPHPDEVVALLHERGVRCIQGNHDRVALGLDGPERCDALAARCLEWTREAISDDTRAALAALPAELDAGDGIHVVHGAPGDPWRYVREIDEATVQMTRVPRARTVVAGHTHVPLLLEADGRRWINPGAVGQSRERRRHVRLAVFDGERVELRVTGYDARRTLRDLDRAGLPREAIHRRPPGALRRVLSAVRRT
jgi:predicted phosphodiesterase